MATFQATYIPIDAHANARVNFIVDNFMTPQLLAFRQIQVNDEVGVLQADGLTYKFSYANWNDTFPMVVRKNGAKLNSGQVFNINYLFGMLDVGPVTRADRTNCTYSFDYFGITVLYGFILRAIDIINTAAVGPATNYDLDNAPNNWDGVIADLALAMCMERLLLDYDLWYGRLIFAIGAAQLEEGGGDITGALETLKQNFEDRAYKTLDNEKFKSGNFLAVPTQYYYQGIRGFGGGGAHNIRYYGKMRGFRPNKYL